MNAPIYDIPLRRIDGTDTRFSDYAGQVLLIVNVASECGKTPQYEGLEELYTRTKDRGFSVLGFPCNQFGSQEPGSESEILGFCRSTYGVDFPMFAKIEVKGENQHPLYRLLTAHQPVRLAGKDDDSGSDVRWNFEKFVVGRGGEVTARFDPDVTPDNPMLLEVIDRELAAPA